MNTIYKYEIKVPPSRIASIELPFGSQVDAARVTASLGGLDTTLTIWAQHETDVKTKVLREFLVFGTGFNLNTHRVGTHIATCFDGPFVWHVYNKA